MQKYSLRKLQTNSRTTFKAGTRCKFFTFSTFYDVKIICELNKKSLSLFSLRTAKFYTQKILLFANLNFCANSVSVHLSNSNFLHSYPRSIIRIMTIAEIVQHVPVVLYQVLYQGPHANGTVPGTIPRHRARGTVPGRIVGKGEQY